MENFTKASVIGAGSWGTAQVKILSENPDLENIAWWIRKEEEARFIAKFGHNPSYLSSATLNIKKISPTSNLEQAVCNSELIVISIPSAFVHETLKSLPENIFKDKYILSTVKGVIPEFQLLVSEYFEKVWKVPTTNITAVSGPCHAEEVAFERLSYLTIASANPKLAEKISTLYACRYIQTKSATDIIGIEYAAVLKNVYAIASGICHGLGYGDNFQAVLVSAAIREMDTFLRLVCPGSRNINDNAYLGDLLVTAYSQFSRNRTFGNMLGKGYSVKSAQMEMNMVAEGYYAAKTMMNIKGQFAISLPILESVHRIIFEKMNAKTEIDKLVIALS